MADEARLPKMSDGLSQESIKVYNHFDRLSDEMLTEILLRLPNCKSVIQSTTVCKRWAVMASHNSFIPNFIALKLGDHTVAFVIHFRPDRICRLGQRYDSFFRPSIFRLQESSFSPLGIDNITSVAPGAIASCKDLLLYCKRDNAKFDYYISNVQTRECVALPSLPVSYGTINLVGFICDSLFTCGREPAPYHYSVVVIHLRRNPSSKLSAHVLSSHCDNQWCTKVLALPKACWLQMRGFYFCFDGKLNFGCGEGFYGFEHNSINEFDDEIECHLVEWPVGLSISSHQVCVSQENLYVSDYCWEGDILSVWVHKEGNNWILQHRIETHEWVSHDSWMAKKLRKFSRHYALSLHPSCSDVIYVVVPGYIFLCNLATKMVEVACEIPVAKRSTKHVNHFCVLPVKFQSWPTPLLRFAHSLK